MQDPSDITSTPSTRPRHPRYKYFRQNLIEDLTFDMTNLVSLIEVLSKKNLYLRCLGVSVSAGDVWGIWTASGCCLRDPACF